VLAQQAEKGQRVAFPATVAQSVEPFGSRYATVQTAPGHAPRLAVSAGVARKSIHPCEFFPAGRRVRGLGGEEPAATQDDDGRSAISPFG